MMNTKIYFVVVVASTEMINNIGITTKEERLELASSLLITVMVIINNRLIRKIYIG